MKKDNNAFKKTIYFILLVAVLAGAGLYFSGALEEESVSMRYVAESVCFISGNYDGVSVFKDEGNHTYRFVCDESKRTKVNFNGREGVLKYDNSKR